MYYTIKNVLIYSTKDMSPVSLAKWVTYVAKKYDIYKIRHFNEDIPPQKAELFL